MAVGDNKQYVVVTVADLISGKADIVRLNVGDSIDGLNAVALLGGSYRESDPWIVALKTKIAAGRTF